MWILSAGLSFRYYLSADVSDVGGLLVLGFLVVYSIGHFWALQWIFRAMSWPLGQLNPRWTSYLLPVLLVTLIVDQEVYRRFHFHLNLLAFRYLLFGQGQVISFEVWDWIKFASVCASSVGLLYLAKRSVSFSPGLQRKIQYFGAAAFVSSHLLHSYFDATFFSPITYPALELPFAAPLKTPDIYEKFAWFDKEKYKHKALLFRTSAGQNLYYPRRATSCDLSPHTKLNLIYIVLDSVRKDALTEDISPNIERFFSKGLSLSKHFSGSNETRGGIFSLFYSIPASYFDDFKNQKKGPILIESLQQADYHLSLFSSAPLTMPEFDQTVFSGVRNLRTHSKAKMAADRDQEAVAGLLADLDTHLDGHKDQPFFGFLFLDSAHEYDLPGNFPQKFLPSSAAITRSGLKSHDELVQIQNRYKNSIHYMDSLLKQVFDYLQAQGLTQNTIVLLTSDHGEEFDDLNLRYWGHNSNFSSFQTQVPLMIRIPPSLQAKVQLTSASQERTSHYDVAPSVLHLLGCPQDPRNISSGRDLFEPKNGVKAIPVQSTAEREPWILQGTLNRFAISGKDSIVVLEPSGDYKTLNSQYRDIPSSQIPWPQVYAAWAERWRFFQTPKIGSSD